MTPRCPCGRFTDDGRFVCDRCEERVLNEIVEDNRRHRVDLWRNRFLDTLEHDRMTDEEMRRTLIEGSERVASKRESAF